MIISSVATRHEDMTGLELMIVLVIVYKVIELFFTGEIINEAPNRTEVSEISELPSKFDFNFQDIGKRIGLRRIIARDEHLQLLSALKMKGCRYKSSPCSFI